MGRRHDVGLQVVGQPARDLARHFNQRYEHLFISGSSFTYCVNRWNYLLRIKVYICLAQCLRATQS